VLKLTVHSILIQVPIRADQDHFDTRAEVRPHWSAKVGMWAAPDDDKARDDLLITECLERERSRLRVLADYLAIHSGERRQRAGQRG
jgi:hypothetical protein